MNKYNKVSWEDVLRKYIEIQDHLYEIGCWIDGVSINHLAYELKTSKYQIRKAYKILKEKGFIRLEEIPTKLEDYDNGLFIESVVVLKTKIYVLTKEGRAYIEGGNKPNE